MNAPPLSVGMAMIVGAFCEHAGKEGDKYTLNKAEVKELIQAQFQDLLGDTNDPKKMDEIFKSLDQNSDDCVTFEEFMISLTAMTIMLFETIRQMDQQQK